ncbi:MAG: hypothetical protein HY898_34990 [Deltaproteobacteria bacterium]|nr:hypothetical protein [Deltaproteobacteria bacterium]
MTPQQAREALLFHSGARPQSDDPRWGKAFLGMLRPYRGLREECFQDVMECLRAVAIDLRGAAIDRELVASLWAICHFGRAWGVSPDGELQRNHLIKPEDVKKLEGWVEQISETVFLLLEGQT